MKIKIVKTTDHDYKSLLARLLQRRGNRQGAVEKRVGEIVRAVERKGDSALLRYAQMFDRVRLTRATMEVKPGEIEKAITTVPAKDLRILRIGGAQAIAALAFGTETIPKVDKIVGPGNIFVATAKRLVFGEVDIDSIAGPSEILLVADESADPKHVAADMLSQAEHDERAAA